MTQKETRARGIIQISDGEPPKRGMPKPQLVFFVLVGFFVFVFWYVLEIQGEVDGTLMAVSRVTGESGPHGLHAPGNGPPYHLYHICLELPTPNTNKIFPELLVITSCYPYKNNNYNPYICSTQIWT